MAPHNNPPLPNEPASMNNGATRDGGLIAGLWTDLTTGKTHGYLLRPRDGTFAPFDPPNSIFTQAWGINASGEVMGLYVDQSGNHHSFLLSRGNFVPIDCPLVTGTNAFGINPQGDVAGIFFDSAGKTHGFLLSRAPKHGE